MLTMLAHNQTLTSLILIALLGLTGCAGQTPRDRYAEAVKARAEGDNQAYYDGMLELADDEPDTRAGRRARANLDSGMWTSLYMLAAVAGGIAGYLEEDAEDEEMDGFLEELEEDVPDSDSPDCAEAPIQEGVPGKTQGL